MGNLNEEKETNHRLEYLQSVKKCFSRRGWGGGSAAVSNSINNEFYTK
jgi:hypothetical protein